MRLQPHLVLLVLSLDQLLLCCYCHVPLSRRFNAVSGITNRPYRPRQTLQIDVGAEEGDDSIIPKVRRVKKNKYAQFSQAPRLDPIEETKKRVKKQKKAEKDKQMQEMQRGTSIPQVADFRLQIYIETNILQTYTSHHEGSKTIGKTKDG